MLTASRILGTEVGSTAPVFLTFPAIHVLGGITAVASGARPAQASPPPPPPPPPPRASAPQPLTSPSSPCSPAS